MKDLDFDELDKAVNSVMGGSPTPASPAPADDPVERDTSSSRSSDQPAAPSLGSLAARRGGRFMDVVHSSSDMTKTPTQQPPISRNSLTLTPPSELLAPAVETEPVIVEESKVEMQDDHSDEPTDEQPATPPQLDTWPDPIDLEQGVNALEAEPLTSPFLPNAKVEKRPLGGSPDEQSAMTDSSTGDSNTPSSSDSVTQMKPSAMPPAPTPVAEQPAAAPSAWGAKLPESDSQLDPSADTKPALPAELDSNLVAIESGEITPKTSDASPAAFLSSGKKLVGGSIPQQYTEQPSLAEPEHVAIYDTHDAQQPLAHPAKKKSSWLWVILIIGFAVAGCGIGAALYFMRII